MFIWLGLLGRVAHIQLWRWRYYREEAKSQHSERLELSARRGRVFDRKGRALTVNRTTCAVWVLPQYVRDGSSGRDTLAGLLARFGLGPRRAIRRELRDRDRLFRLAKGVDAARGDSLRLVLARRRFRNCTLVEDVDERVYPYGASCASVLGMVGGEGRGLAGLEARFDSTLRGRPGWVLLQRDAIGQSLPDPSYPRAEPVPGADLHTTVDADVQQLCYRALERAVRKCGAKDGSAIVLEAGSGAVLAISDYPAYVPARFRSADTTRLRSAAVCEAFEPGSSFKPVLGVAALESRDAGRLLRERFDVSAGYIQIGKYKIGDVHKNGVLDFAGLFIRSSNPGCAQLSMMLDPRQFYDVARELGFCSPVGIGLPGEEPGSLDRPRKLNRLRFANVSFGQGLTVTLLQLAAAYLAIANDGEYVKPYLVERVVDAGETVCCNGRTPVRRAMRPETARMMKSILGRAVAEGTGELAALPGVEVCGKTGTAQKCEPWGGYSKTRSLMSFVGFFPREQPRYVVAVLLDEPTSDRFASSTACPTFSEIGRGLLDLERMEGRLPALTELAATGR